MAYQSKFKSDANDELFRAILSLENEEECYRFFEDLTTIKELNDMALRWQVARLLNENKTYAEIAEITNASTATISRVNKCLIYGAEGYNIMLNK